MKFSVERLVHFQCGECGKWWSIGDAPLERRYFCPWCGKPDKSFRNELIKDDVKPAPAGGEARP